MASKKRESVGIVETKYFTFAEKEDDYLTLDSGARLGPITVAYETYGNLNKKADNAILLVHAWTGDAHAAGFHDAKEKKSGWWDEMVGPGKAIDTRKYFVICSNVLGGCGGTTGPSSIDPKTGKHYGVGFPVVTIGDIVQVQKKLIDFLGIKKLLAVAGGSMGGMQALEWALRYPDAITSCIVIASTTRLSAQSIGFNAVGRTTIMTDPNWKDGQYYGKEIPSTGLAIARMIGHITFLSDKSMHEKFGRRLQSREKFGFDLRSEFEVESYLDYQGQKFVERFDANSYLYATKAMDYFDLAAYYGDGDLIKAMERAKCRFLVLSFTSDWLFPTYQSVELVDALAYIGLDVTYLDIDSPYGHDSFLLEYEFEEEIIVNFLDATFKKRGGRK